MNRKILFEGCLFQSKLVSINKVFMRFVSIHCKIFWILTFSNNNKSLAREGCINSFILCIGFGSCIFGASSFSQLLQDKHVPPESALPPNMVDYHLEKALSPICIDHERRPETAPYGTRTQTVLVIDHAGAGYFAERDRYCIEQDRIVSGSFPAEYEFALGS